jgi:hypothetical protein
MSTIELPIVPFDGMKFIDSWRREWEYNLDTVSWIFRGYVPNIPVADENTIGLLSSNLKSLLDSIPEKAGGFGILTKYSFGKVSGNGFNGLMTGDIVLKSNTLDIKCRDQNGKLITKTCASPVSSPEINKIPSIDINFGEDFLNSICIEIPGSKGPKGIQGQPGLDGEDGFGDGPQGLKGNPGKDATGISEVDSVTIEIDESFYDTAVVNVELDQQNSILSITKAKLAVPDDNTPADQFVVMPIIRSLEWTNGLNYNIVQPSNENLSLEANVSVLAYPKDFDPNIANSNSEISRKSLSSFVDQIINNYQTIYNGYITEYDKEIKDYFFAKDDEARKALDSLVSELASKQFGETFEYCMGLADNGICGQKPRRDLGEYLIKFAIVQITPFVQEILNALYAIAQCACSAAAAASVKPTLLESSTLNDISSNIIANIASNNNVNIQELKIGSPMGQSDLCNFIPQILEACGQLSNETCQASSSKLLAKIDLKPGDVFNIKNDGEKNILSRGVYLIQYINGAIIDESQKDNGFVVGSGIIDSGLVLNIESKSTITRIPMPMSSQISNPLDKSNVINSYLTGPLTEMVIGVLAETGDKVWVEFVTKNMSSSSGSLSLYVKYCARC